MIPTWVRATKRKYKDQDGVEREVGDNGLYINDLRKFVKGGFLVPALANNPLVVPAGGAINPAMSAPVVWEGAQDGVRQIFSMVGAFDAATLADVQNRFSVLFTDTAYRRRLMNRDVLVNHVYGTPGNPFLLPKAITLENQQTMLGQYFNNSAAGVATFRQQFEVRDFQAQSLTRDDVTQLIGEERKKSLFFNPFWLTSDAPVSLPASRSGFALFSNSRDYYLQLRYIIVSVITTGVAGDTQEFFTARILDAKTGRPLMTHPVSMNMVGGSASFPYVLPCPLMVEPATSIAIEFTNLITDAALEIFFTFHGVGMYVANANPWETQAVDNPAVTMPTYGAS